MKLNADDNFLLEHMKNMSLAYGQHPREVAPTSKEIEDFHAYHAHMHYVELPHDHAFGPDIVALNARAVHRKPVAS